MLTSAQNELLPRSGPGTAIGDLFRRFWQPVLLSRQLAGRDGPPVRVTVLGEDLVAFRDTEGHVGLVEARCPHRRGDDAPLRPSEGRFDRAAALVSAAND